MNMKRMRGRNHRGGSGGGGGGGGGGGPIRHQSGNVPLNRNHVFDSSGPDLRVRGTSQQLFEKYLQLGRDATSSGDRVMAESYFQHAEHYFRILNAMNQAAAQQGGGATAGGNQGAGGQHGNNQRRNDSAADTQGEGNDGADDGEEPAGFGEQPGNERNERDIPITTAPPEG